jgi:hypothetical protein
MYQQLWGIKLEEKLYMGVREQKRLNTTGLDKLHAPSVKLSQYRVWLRAGRPGDRGSIPGRGKRIFPLASVSRPALGSTQPPVQWVPGVLSQGLKRGKSDHSPHLVPSSRMSRSYTPLLPKRLLGV